MQKEYIRTGATRVALPDGRVIGGDEPEEKRGERFVADLDPKLEEFLLRIESIKIVKPRFEPKPAVFEEAVAEEKAEPRRRGRHERDGE